MIHRLRIHIRYYLALIFMQIAGFLVLLSLSGKSELQITVIIASTFVYVAWAILHQYLEHSLTKKIVVEYVLFGVFGLIVSLLFFK